MTFPGGSAILLLFMLAISPWLGVEGQDVVLPNGKVDEGEALELFFKYTLPGSKFEANRTCDWNETLIICDSQHSTVLHLNFSGLNLTGEIPVGSITNLTGLLSLDLSNNHLTGNLPEVYNLPHLSNLTLSGNSFYGPLLDENIPVNLSRLDLSRNAVTGPIPPSLFSLSGLVSLILGSNSLEGHTNVTALTANPSLQTLDLSNNSLTGDLPQQLSSNMSLLDLHDNQFEGNVVELLNSLGSSSSLTVLDLSSNNFDLQTFPSDFSHLIHLTTLRLGNIKFISHSFPTLPNASLVILNLSGTNLLGNIPDAICNISRLAFLDLSNNNLEGSIPVMLGKLSQLEKLDLSRNNLSGQFPPNMNDLTFLSYLNVSYNNLSGPIPTGTQFSTFPSTSYLGGNPGLCGASLRSCSNSTSGNEQTAGKKKSKDFVAIITGSVSGVVLMFLVAVILFVWCRVSRAVKPLAKDEIRNVSGPMLFEKDAETWATRVKDPSSIMVVMFEKPLLNLSFADLLLATGNFSKEMQIADGVYGPVYKGVLPDTTQLAVKVLVEVGLDVIYADEKNAVARIDRLAKVKHSNLVPLVGYCLVGDDCILIYEYMVNGDLQRWLHELPEGTRNPEDWSLDTWEHLEGVDFSGEYLSWPTRHKIALGIARALAFLHHGCSPHIIHRDVKSSNILLDDGFNAFLVDSGLACTARINGTPIIGGTLGYVPPEYGQTWQATTRGDVYSFGVVLLELVSGRKPTGHYFHDSYGGNLVGWVRSMIKQDKRGQKVLDPKLVGRGHVPEMLEVLRIGYLCTTETPAKRPSMQQVVGLLKDCQSG